MFDMMTITKAGASLCAALLFLLLGGWAAETLYHVGGKHYAGDKDHEVVQGYRIAVESSDEPAAEVVEVAFADVYATADAGAGERQWRQCSACHKLEAGANGTGPYLHGVVNRPKGVADGYAYSETLATMGGEWSPENIANFIANSREYAPGTKMNYSFRGSVEDKANLIAYMATFN